MGRFVRWGGWAGSVALMALGLAGVAAFGDEGTRPVHNDADALEAATLATASAFFRSDLAVARAEMDKISRATRRLTKDDDEVVSQAIRAYDQAFHMTLDGGRELASAGELKGAFEQFSWVMKACVECHVQSREQGLYVP